MLHLLYIIDLPVALDTTTAIYDRAILAAQQPCRNIPAFTRKLFLHPEVAKWRIERNGAKSVQMTFTTRRETCTSNLERLENTSSRRRYTSIAD